MEKFISTTIDVENGLMFINPLNIVKLNLVEILSSIIDSKFHQSSNLFYQDIKLINYLRNNSLIPPTEIYSIDLKLITSLRKYHYIYDELINLKFFSNNNDEKLNIIYQLSSYYSILAIQESKLDIENLKKAAIYFQYSAGYLNSLDQNSSNWISLLMLIQSQEIYLKIAIIDNLKFSVLLKLSNQISDYYSQIYKLNPNSYFNLKSIYFKLITYNLYSKICHNDKKLNDQLIYLHECNILINKFNHLLNNIDNKYSSLLQDFENLKIEILNNLNNYSSININDIILPQKIKKLPMILLAKPLLPNNKEFQNTFEIFNNTLLPLNLVNEILEFQNRFNDFINLEIKIPVNLLNDKLNESLNIYNLKFENQIKTQLNLEIPENLLTFRNKLLQFNNIIGLEEKINVINSLKLNCRHKLNSIWDLLKNQIEFENENLISQWHENLNSIENDEKGGVLINTFKIYENYLVESNKSDKLILTQFNDLKPFLTIYDDLNNLKDYLPDSNLFILNPSLESIITNMNQIKNSLTSLFQERVSFLEKVNKKSLKINFVDLYKDKNSNNNNNDNENEISDIFKHEILKFDREIDYISKTKLNQEILIKKFNSFCDEFKNLNKNLKISPERANSINVLHLTFNGYFDILENLNQSHQFYQNLLDNLEVKSILLNEFLNKRNEKIKKLIT